jgi:hypothetical protein
MRLENLLIYDRHPLLIPKAAPLKKTREFEARLEEAAVLPYLIPGQGLAMVLRPPELVTSQTRVAAYRNLVVTDGHPSEGEAHKVGKGLVLSAEVFDEGLNGSIVIHDEALLQKIYDEGIIELSPGYYADVIPSIGEYKGVPYQYRHANYAVNGIERLEHQAIVKHGRHGASTALKIEDSCEYCLGLTWEEAKSVIDLNNVKINDNSLQINSTNTGGEAMPEDTTKDTTKDAAQEMSDQVSMGAEQTAEAVIEAVEAVEESSPEEQKSELAEIKEMLLTFFAQHSASECPKCAEAARMAQEAEKVEKPVQGIENALQLDEDAIGDLISLSRIADSVGVVYETIDLTRNIRGVQTRVAAKLGLKIEDSYTDREVGILIKGSANAIPQTSGIGNAVNAIKAAQAKIDDTSKTAQVHPLTGIL